MLVAYLVDMTAAHLSQPDPLRISATESLLGPADVRTLTFDEVEALDMFMAEYRGLVARHGRDPRFQTLAFSQTYRRECRDLVPNHPHLVPSADGLVRFPSDAFPIGTTVAIHCAPLRGKNAFLPAGPFQCRAKLERHLLYCPANETMYVFDCVDGEPALHVARMPEAPAPVTAAKSRSDSGEAWEDPIYWNPFRAAIL